MERVGILTFPLFAVCLIGGTSLGVALGWGSVNAVNGMSTNVGGEISQRLRRCPPRVPGSRASEHPTQSGAKDRAIAPHMAPSAISISEYLRCVVSREMPWSVLRTRVDELPE